MIKGMPAYAQGPIQNYLDTGNFKNHKKEYLPQDMDSKETMAELRGGIDEFVQLDNVEGFDQDPRPGYLKVDGFFNVSGGYTKGEDGTTEMFQLIGNKEEGAVIYTRDNVDSMDVVVVSNAEGADEGVQHYDSKNPTQSFMTFPAGQ